MIGSIDMKLVGVEEDDVVVIMGGRTKIVRIQGQWE